MKTRPLPYALRSISTDYGAATDGTPTTSDFPDARIYVDAHNTVRAAVPEPADYSGSWAPVPPVTWSAISR